MWHLSTIFPRLDARHILDAFPDFDVGWSGRNMFKIPAECNVQIDVCAFLRQACSTQSADYLTPRRLIEEIQYLLLLLFSIMWESWL